MEPECDPKETTTSSGVAMHEKTLRRALAEVSFHCQIPISMELYIGTALKSLQVSTAPWGTSTYVIRRQITESNTDGLLRQDRRLVKIRTYWV